MHLNHAFTALHHFDDAKLAKIALDVSGFVGDSGQHLENTKHSFCNASTNASTYAGSNRCIIANTSSDLSSIEEPDDLNDDLSIDGLDVWMSDTALQLKTDIVFVDAPTTIKTSIRQFSCDVLPPSTNDGASSPPSVLTGRDPIPTTFQFNENASVFLPAQPEMPDGKMHWEDLWADDCDSQRNKGDIGGHRQN